MSARKGFETKLAHDENTDSGFLSGPISEQLTEEFDTDDRRSDTDERREVPEDRDVRESYKVQSEVVDLDSGLDLCAELDGLRVEDEQPTPTPTARVPTFTVTDSADIPPLAILFQQDDDGDTQLHIAAVHGCEKSVGTLIRVCPEKYLLDMSNDYGHTALHLAVMSSHAVVARMLVRAGASLGVRDLNGDTPVHLATAAKSVDCLQALLAPIEKQPLSKKLATILNQKNYEGQTCVHLAATSGHRQTLQTLVYYGADINSKEGMAGWTALHIAARRGDAKLAQYLLQCGVLAHTRDYAGRTPRRLARRVGAFSADDRQRFMAALPDDSDSDSDDDDEYDSEGDTEALFDRLRGSMTVASLVSN